MYDKQFIVVYYPFWWALKFIETKKTIVSHKIRLSCQIWWWINIIVLNNFSTGVFLAQLCQNFDFC